MKKILTILTFTLTSLVSLPSAVQAQEQQPFEDWLGELREEARERGVGEQTLDTTLATIEEPVPRVLELDRSQPEFVQTFTRYMNNRISQQRIERGRRLLDEHADLFDRIQREYGVQPHYLVAFWALESNFGDYTGGFSVLNALATLAYDQRRSSFFREELLTALEIVDAGHIEHDRMSGSWAGAMGQCQFLPSTFKRFGVDGDGDGRIDIWNSLPDIFASAAHFLSESGWRGNERWGREVLLPEDFDYTQTGLNDRKPVSAWDDQGVRRVNGDALGQIDSMEGSIILPAGAEGPAFIVYNNFRTTLVWNRSNFYAISVGHLANRFVGGPPIQHMPEEEEALSREEVIELQEALNALGYEAGEADGIPGSQTRAAIRAFQEENDLPADGHASQELLSTLRVVAFSE